MPSGWLLAIEIGVGTVVFVILITAVVWCICRSRRRRAALRETAALIDDEDRGGHPTGGYGGGGMSVNSGEWMFGELDYSGLKRVLDWLAEVRKAFAKYGGIEPISDDIIVDSARLGQIDDIGSPPQGYSPRVSAIGSDEGSAVPSIAARQQARDPLRR